MSRRWERKMRWRRRLGGIIFVAAVLVFGFTIMGIAIVTDADMPGPYQKQP